MKIENLIELLRTLPPTSREAQLQKNVALALSAAGYQFREEEWLDARNRLDFIVFDMEMNGFPMPRVAIELKVNGSALSIARQLYRYADHCECIILLCTLALPAWHDDQIIHGELTGNACRVVKIEIWQNPIQSNDTSHPARNEPDAAASLIGWKRFRTPRF